MNAAMDETDLTTSRPLSPETLRVIAIVLAVAALVNGLNGVMAAIGLGVLALFVAGWDVARMKAALRSQLRDVLKD
jgi:hypothetical protein